MVITWQILNIMITANTLYIKNMSHIHLHVSDIWYRYLSWATDDRQATDVKQATHKQVTDVKQATDVKQV